MRALLFGVYNRALICGNWYINLCLASKLQEVVLLVEGGGAAVEARGAFSRQISRWPGIQQGQTKDSAAKPRMGLGFFIGTLLWALSYGIHVL